MRVDIYRNLNRQGIWFSVRHKGLVREYRQSVTLSNCRMKHATAKQLCAVRDGRRQVCQWISGDLLTVNVEPEGQWRLMVCDPRKADGFVDAETGERVDRAQWVRFSADGKAQYIATCAVGN